MNLRIADMGIRLTGLPSDLAELVRDRYAPFESDVPAEFEFCVEASDDMYREARLVPLEENPVRVEGKDGHYRIRRLDNPFDAELDLGTGRCAARIGPNLMCFDSLLRVAYSVILSATDGFMLHSVCVRVRDKAIIAAGISGAGKTTFSRSGFSDVLTDELVAVREFDGVFMAYGTPFWGEGLAGITPDSAPIDGLYLLRKGSADKVVAASKSAALLELLACTYFFGPRESCGAVLDRTGRLVERSFHGLLEFVPSEQLASFVSSEVDNRVA